MTDAAETTRPSSAPARQGLVLTTLILVAAVANLNLTVANTALPDIGKAFEHMEANKHLGKIVVTL